MAAVSRVVSTHRAAMSASVAVDLNSDLTARHVVVGQFNPILVFFFHK